MVTGATGFIGRRCVAALNMLGADILAVGKRRSAEFSCDVAYRSMQLEDMPDNAEWLSDFSPQYVLHLASPPDKDSSAKVEREFSRVIAGNINFLSQVSEIPRIQGVALAGSIKELGRAAAPYTSTAAPMPASPYAVAKAANTAFAYYLHTTRRVPVRVLRLPIVYGPGQPGNSLIAQACRAALSDGTLKLTSGRQVREILFLDDAVRALLAALSLCNKMEICSMNVGSGEPVSVLDLVQTIMALAKSRATVQVGSLPSRPSDIEDMRVDSSLFRSVTGWEPKFTLQDGLSATLEWYRDTFHE